jgi:hypothetical protein
MRHKNNNTLIVTIIIVTILFGLQAYHGMNVDKSSTGSSLYSDIYKFINQYEIVNPFSSSSTTINYNVNDNNNSLKIVSNLEIEKQNLIKRIKDIDNIINIENKIINEKILIRDKINKEKNIITTRSTNSPIKIDHNIDKIEIGNKPVNKKIISDKDIKKDNANEIKKSSFLLPPDSNKDIKKEINKSCPYDIKVYVYTIPKELPSVRFSEEARHNKTLHVCQKCILEQFSIEYILYDFFTQFCGRTENPDEADFFYLPIIRDAEYRIKLDSKSGSKRQPSITELALINLLENKDSKLWMETFKISDKYWYKHDGGDHIIAMPAPVTNLRHETSKRGFFHYMIHLYPPIFLALEYSSSFVNEYPICTQQKNILIPYPTTDPDLYNGKLHAGLVERNSLLYYAGGMHGDCVEVRRAMKFLIQNSSSLPGVLPHVKHIQAEREHGFRAATFCPVPVGDSPSSKRMYDVLNFGCIPVVLSDDLVWAYSRHVGGPVDPELFMIQIPQIVVQYTSQVLLKRFELNKEKFGILPDGEFIYNLLEQSYNENKDYQNGIYVNPLVQILQKISQKNINILRSGVLSAAPSFRYYKLRNDMINIPTSIHEFPSGGAIDLIVKQLIDRKLKGINKMKNKCQEERLRKDHKYISRYPCEYTIKRRLTTMTSLLEFEEYNDEYFGLNNLSESSLSGCWPRDSNIKCNCII